MKNSQVPPNKKDKKIPPKSAVIKKRLIFVAIGLVILSLAAFGIYETGRHSGWWGDSDSVKILRSEPIATKEFADIETLLYETTPPQEDNYKAPPYVRRWLASEILNQEEVFRRVIEFAKKDGWARYSDQDANDHWSGYKTINKEERRMTIGIKKLASREKHHDITMEEPTTYISLGFW